VLVKPNKPYNLWENSIDMFINISNIENDQCNGSTECDSFNNSRRNEAISYMYKKLNKSLVKVATTLTTCQIKYNNFLSKLYFNAIANVDAKALCSLNPNTKDKILSNINIYSDKLIANNLYPYLERNTIYYKLKSNEDKGKLDWDFIATDKPSDLWGDSVDGVLTIKDKDLCFENCYKLTLKITGINSSLCPNEIAIKDTTNPSYIVIIKKVYDTTQKTATYDFPIPIRINQYIYISNFDLQGGAMSATLTNTGECFQNILSVYDFKDDSEYLPAQFTPKGPGYYGDYVLDYTYINKPRLTTDYINWNTTTSILPCIDPLKGRAYEGYIYVYISFITPVNPDFIKFTLNVYLGSKENGFLLISGDETTNIYIGGDTFYWNDENLIATKYFSVQCGTTISKIHFEYIGSKPDQILKLGELKLSFDIV
jgi:hypothetical protein